MAALIRQALILAIFVSETAVAVEGPEILPPGRQLRPIQVSRTVFMHRQINMQTQLAVDPQDTAFLMSVYANGLIRSLRISRKKVVKTPVMYMGWPYILDKKGRLWAMDTSWKTQILAKTPVVLKRLVTKFPRAAGFGVGMLGFGWLEHWLYGEGAFVQGFSSLEMAGAGFVTFYIVDAATTFLFRSHFRLQRGGNFFKTKIADNVMEIVPEAGTQDWVVRFRDSRAGDPITLLSSLAPDYTKKTNCIYELTRMLNE